MNISVLGRLLPDKVCGVKHVFMSSLLRTNVRTSKHWLHPAKLDRVPAGE